jgi:aldehyde dehydrogenase
MEHSKITVRNPFTNEAVGTVPNLSTDEVRQVVLSCAQTSEMLPAHERAASLRRVAQFIAEDAESWAQLISQESGLSLYDTRHEVARALEVIEWGAAIAVNGRGEIWTSDAARGHSDRICCSFRGPMPGAALVITPFNHPLNQVVHKLVPAIVSGARAVLKPSEKTPLTAIRLVELLRTAGLPPEQIQVITGDPEIVVSAALNCEEITGLAFTGSTRIGRKLGFRAGPRRLSLELGSIDSAIVLDTADIEQTAQTILRGAFANSGQRCTAVKRIVVVDELAEALVTAMADHMIDWVCGDPLSTATRVGTVIDTRAAEFAAVAVKAAQADGATLLAGGQHHGTQVLPTLIDGCRLGMILVDTEVFAPIAPVIRVRNVEEAITVANAGPYGLSCGVFTQSIERATFMARHICSGSVNINEVPSWRLEVTPFGGTGDSGIGIKEGILRATEFFQFERLVTFDAR